MDTYNKALIGSSIVTVILSIAFVAAGFGLRFGGGLGEFVKHAKKHDDFLELKRLDIVFSIFTSAGLLLVLFFPLAIIGIRRESTLILNIHGIAVWGLVVLELMVGFMAFTYGDEVNELDEDARLLTSINNTMEYWRSHNQTKPPKAVMDIDTEFWTVTQRTLSCCGSKNYRDWTLWADKPDVLESYECRQTKFEKGCAKEIRHRVHMNSNYFGITAMVLLAVAGVSGFLSGYEAFLYDQKL